MRSLKNALDFYRGKRVLITGHTGFKGAWLALWMTKLGASVVGYSLEPPSTPNLYDAIGLDNVVRSEYGDICDVEHTARFFAEAKPDIVFHLAAQAIVRESYLSPMETLSVNVMGTASILEAVRRTPSVRCVIVVTSDKCYENTEQLWGMREVDPMGGSDPYSASKGCAELVAQAWNRSFFLDNLNADHCVAMATVRAGNVIGGGDWGKNRLLPDCMRAFFKGKSVEIRSPHSVRPWQHVLDPLSGYILLASLLYEKGQKWCGGWNFGPQELNPWTVEQVATKAAELCGSGQVIVDKGAHPHEAKYLRLDCSKAALRLDWQAVLKVSDAISMSVDWYKQFYSAATSEQLREFTFEQIAIYEKLAFESKA